MAIRLYGERGVVLGHRPAQHVGEVVLLVAELVDGGDLVRRRTGRAPAGRHSLHVPRPTGRPAPARSPRTRPAAGCRTRARSRASGSARPRRPPPPTAATGRPGPRPGPSRRRPSTASAEPDADPVVEHREPGERPLLRGAEQVPRPRDHRGQGLVPRRRGAVAAAEHGEPVVEPLAELLERHRPDPRGGELDRQGQPVEPGHHVVDEVGVEVGVGSGGRGPSYEQGGAVGRRRAGRAARRARPRCSAAPGWW